MRSTLQIVALLLGACSAANAHAAWRINFQAFDGGSNQVAPPSVPADPIIPPGDPVVDVQPPTQGGEPPVYVGTTPASVPEPNTLALLGVGLVAVGLAAASGLNRRHQGRKV